MSLAPLLCLPTEIRLQVLQALLANHDNKVLRIRTERPEHYERRRCEKRQRCIFRFIADRMRSRSAESTYNFASATDQILYPSISRVNRQLHVEASHELYSKNAFDFGADIESIVPFLSDLTPAARSSIKHIKITKRALPYTKDFDRSEWESACKYMSQRLCLEQLDLGIFGGTPALLGQPVAFRSGEGTFTKSDFMTLANMEEMEWAVQVTAIRGLRTLNVHALLEHCPIPSSNAMAFFVTFSASIEQGFAEYLKEAMVTGANKSVRSTKMPF